jgi:hypothetical protein
MTTIFRARSDLLRKVRGDLQRPHEHAAERVGFLLCRAASRGGEGLLILAADYHSVADEDYLRDESVGAMMGPAAIRKAMQRAYAGGSQDVSVFHVHTHGHQGLPGFSDIDDREGRRFVPDFFNAAPDMPHGMIVLSHDRAFGLCWRSKSSAPRIINRFASVGAPLDIWEIQE